MAAKSVWIGHQIRVPAGKKIPKSICSRFAISFCHVFGRFSVKGVKKHGKTIKINPLLALFWPLTHPPPTWSPASFVLPAALVLVPCPLCFRRTGVACRIGSSGGRRAAVYVRNGSLCVMALEKEQGAAHLRRVFFKAPGL
jgi:hypothetical protein